MSQEPVRLAMWSGPRNISTAMMRSFENRPDCVVVDEPLYAAYLQRTGLDHPARDEVIGSQPTDVGRVVESLLAPVDDGIRLHYTKHMAQHLDLTADRSWVGRFRTVMLVRDPREVVASYVRSREACEPADIGLLQQVTLFEELAATGAEPPVLDAADFLRAPEAHLRWLCDWAGVGFSDRMLSWPSGPRASDGVWAPHWYSAVWASTGFQPWRPRNDVLSEHDAAVAEACLPAYRFLHARRVVV